MATKKKGLGRGLNALIEDANISTESYDEESVIKKVPINDIEPNKDQPRKRFDQEKLEELAESIKEHGLMQPIIVKKENNGYRIIAGERRWRASRLAELEEVPVIIKDIDEKETMELALIENIQREDLNVIEEAEAYEQLIQKFDFTQEMLAKRLGKSRPAIANALRLLSLDPYVRGLVADAAISSGHARCLVTIKDSEIQCKVAEYIIDNDLNVRETEALAKDIADGKADIFEKKTKKPSKKKKSIEIKNLEKKFESALGTKVSIKNNDAEKKGKIILEYYSYEDIDRILAIICNEE